MGKKLSVKQDEKGKYGFVGEDGNWVIEPKFKDAEEFSNGLAIIQLRSKWGVIDSNGDTVIKANFDDIRNLPFNFFKVKINGKYGILDKNGKTILEAKYDDIETSCSLMLGSDLFGKIPALRFLDEDDPAYEYSTYMDLYGEDCEIVWVDSHGNVFFSIEDDYWGCSNFDKSVMIKPEFDSINRQRCGVFVAQKDYKYGVIDTQGNWIIKPEYRYIDDFTAGIASAILPDDTQIWINLKGEKIENPFINSSNVIPSGMVKKKLDAFGIEYFFDAQNEDEEGMAAQSYLVPKSKMWGYIFQIWTDGDEQNKFPIYDLGAFNTQQPFDPVDFFKKYKASIGMLFVNKAWMESQDIFIKEGEELDPEKFAVLYHDFRPRDLYQDMEDWAYNNMIGDAAGFNEFVYDGIKYEFFVGFSDGKHGIKLPLE